MSEKIKHYAKVLCKLMLQALLILIVIFIGLYIFGGLIIFGALSQA